MDVFSDSVIFVIVFMTYVRDMGGDAVKFISHRRIRCCKSCHFADAVVYICDDIVSIRLFSMQN